MRFSKIVSTTILLTLLFCSSYVVCRPSGFDFKDCPRNCSCPINGKIATSVYCVDQGIYPLPGKLPQNTKFAMFQHISIRRLTDYAFSLWPTTLQILKLNWNQMENISTGAFVKLDSLSKLDLSFNNITRISHINFPSSLNKIDLTHNPVQYIDIGICKTRPNLKIMVSVGDENIDVCSIKDSKTFHKISTDFTFSTEPFGASTTDVTKSISTSTRVPSPDEEGEVIIGHEGSSRRSETDVSYITQTVQTYVTAAIVKFIDVSVLFVIILVGLAMFLLGHFYGIRRSSSYVPLYSEETLRKDMPH